MSARVQGWVWDLEVAPQPKLILLWLANRATDAGVCFPTKRELARRTGLSERMVRYHLETLARGCNEAWTSSEPVLSIIERRVAGDRNTSNVYVLRVPWADAETVRAELDELKYIPDDALEGVGTTGCTQGGDAPLHPLGTTGCMENRSLRERHRNTPPKAPSNAPTNQQQQGIAEDEHATQLVLESKPQPQQAVDDTAEQLVLALYRGMGGDVESVTPAIRRRDQVIARQLVAAGASPDEAEAYARETVASIGRIAPVDLRSFERERLGWLARRRGHVQNAQARYIDRTGQPAPWESPGAQTSSRAADAAVNLIDEQASPELAGSRSPARADGSGLADRLQALLLGRSD